MSRELSRYLGECCGWCELLILDRYVAVVSLEVLQDGLHVLRVDASVHLQRYLLRRRRGEVVEVIVAPGSYHEDRNDDCDHLGRSPDGLPSQRRTTSFK